MIMICLFQEVLSATRCLRGTKEAPPMSSTTGTMTGSGGGTGGHVDDDDDDGDFQFQMTRSLHL